LQQKFEFWLIRIATPDRPAHQRAHSRKIRGHERAENGPAEPPDNCPEEKGQQKRDLVPLFVHDLVLILVNWPFNLAGECALRSY
jgi:hypothetical protein